jgi:cytochrome c peroxidase
MRFIHKIILAVSVLSSSATLAHGPGPVSLQNVPIPPVPGLLDGADPIVVNKNMAIALGKALFWDMGVGSDGQACASCHFSAGADVRIKNQINPGQNSSYHSGQTFSLLPSGTGGPNHTLTLADFPLHQFSDPLDNTSSVIFSTDDVVGSAGTFSGQYIGSSKFTGENDQCIRGPDPIFNVNYTGVRKVEPRNTPTVINAVFNHRNFWDGRANNVFNGSSPWGMRDKQAGVWIKQGARSVVKKPLNLINSSLASQAVTPPIFNNIEMGCESRIWPDIGRKLLLRQPLQNQQVHNQDSVLGPLSLSQNGNLKPGLNTIYMNMITQAFNSKYWSYSGTGQFGSPPGGAPYNQMEANFSMFFGIAIQLYESTLVSDQSPFDLSPVTSTQNGLWTPTWSNIDEGSPPATVAKIAALKAGFLTFTESHCGDCHSGPNFSSASIATNSLLLTPIAGSTFGPPATPIPYGPGALGSGTHKLASFGVTQYGNIVNRDFNNAQGQVFMDMGYFNTGVGDPDSDSGIAGTDPFGNPLSFSAQYVSYLAGNSAGILDPGISSIRACDFSTPLAYNANPEKNPYLNIPGYFSETDGLIPDGTREGVLRNQNCVDPNTAYIPSIAAAQANLTGPEMGVGTQAAFKVPTLRNIELTGPYMHNGGMAILQQVLEFYARQSNFPNDNLSFNILSVQGNVSDTNIAPNLITFLKALTDERVRYEKAPFDHPQLTVLHGHVGNDQQVTPGNPLDPSLAQDQYLELPAVGADGLSTPVKAFLSTSP